MQLILQEIPKEAKDKKDKQQPKRQIPKEAKDKKDKQQPKRQDSKVSFGCSNCAESYDLRYLNPLLLSCWHTICGRCIEKKDAITCSICQVQSPIPAMGLLPNLAIRSLLEVQAFNAGPQKCPHCNDPATFRCLDCAEWYCESMAQSHLMIRYCRDHVIIPYSKLTSKDIRPRLMCVLHPKKEVEFYCTPCKVLICGSCPNTSHHGHLGQDIPVAFKEQENAVKQQIAQAEKKIAEIEKAAERVTAEKTKVIEQRAKISGDIEAYFRKIQQYLDAAQQESIRELDNETKKREKDLEDQITRLRRDLNELSTSHQQLCGAVKEQNKPRVLHLQSEVSGHLAAPTRQNVQSNPGRLADMERLLDESFTGKRPVILFSGASPERCEVKGSGAVVAIPGYPAKFDILCKNSKNEPQSGAPIIVELKGDFKEPVQPTIKDQKNGVYNVELTLPQTAKKGKCTLLVSLYGRPISGFPRDLFIYEMNFTHSSPGMLRTPPKTLTNPDQTHRYALISQSFTSQAEWKVRIDALQSWIMFGVVLTSPTRNDSHQHVDNYGIASNKETYIEGKNTPRTTVSEFKQGDVIICRLAEEAFSVFNSTQNWTENVKIPGGREWFPHFVLHGANDKITLLS